MIGLYRVALFALLLLLPGTLFGSNGADVVPDASMVDADTTNFNNNLSSADNTVQKALDKLDEVAGGGGAPTNADYLVGTANASLSAEIVVGTTPGGELGGTWGSPTVDATHSGSAHHGAVTLGTDADVLLGLTTQQIDLDSQSANTVLAGPASGAATDPTFRALVDDDVPNTITLGNLTQVTTRNHSDLGGVTSDQHHARAHAMDSASDHSAATLGNLAYGGVAGAWTLLSGNTTTTKNFLTQTGTGTVSAAPAWGTIADADVPDTLTRDTEWDTEGEVQAAWGAVNILLETEIDASSELLALMDDETGTGLLMFATSPTITTDITIPNTGLHLLESGVSPVQDLIIAPGSALTVDRTLTITTGDADRTVTLNGDTTLSGTNTGDVTLAGTPDYVTIIGQTITRGSIDLAADVTGTLPVSNGGTGAATLTDGGILLGSGTGAITALGAATNGQIPIGDGTTDPVLATITGTANETEVTNGAGSITVGLPSNVILTTSLAVNATDPADAGAVRLNNAETIAWEASPAGIDETLTVSADENFQMSAPLELDASDPADSGALRLDNNEAIAWEASPAGTDVTLLVDASEVLQASGALNAGGNITGANLSGTNTGDQTITLTGDVTGSGTGSFAATIADNSVDGTDIALGLDAQGDVMYYDGTNWVRLAKGTAGQVLEMNAGATAPEWDADDGGTDTNANWKIDVPGPALLPLEAADSIPPLSKDTGTNLDTLTTNFDQATDEGRLLEFELASDTAAGTVTFTVWWSSTATTGNVIWNIRHSGGDIEGESWDSALTTIAAAADAVQATTDLLTKTSVTETIANLGWVAGDFIQIMLYRDANAAGDTLAADARVHHVHIEGPRA